MMAHHANHDVIRVFSGERMRAATSVLCRAFADDPILTHYLNEPKRRRPAFRAFFGDVLYGCRRFGHVYVTLRGRKLIAAAAWRPPDADAPTPSELRHSRLAERRVRSLFPRTAGGIFDGFAKLQEKHPSAPHWYLCFVGVAPGLQGQGIGARLLAPVLALADQTRTLCYLETPFPRTHEFYRRLGFKIADESHPFVGAPTLWTMIREPRHNAQPINSVQPPLPASRAAVADLDR